MKRWGFHWKETCGIISTELDDFFENIYNNSKNANLANSVHLAYREGQHNFALDILEAIKKQAILLIEGGVGIGKSYGYLLPIFYTNKNDSSFKKIIISTSSIALQEQLIKDIENVSKMLEIPIEAGIVKGINNYACLSEIKIILENEKTDEDTKKVVNELLADIRRKNTSDKTELIKVSKEVWSKVKLKGRGSCSSCSYSTRCPYYKSMEDINKLNIIVTNHGNLAKNIIDKTELTENLDMLIFDESHKILENIRAVREQSLKLEEIKNLIKNISKTLNGYGIQALLMSIEKVFSGARASASKNYFSTNEERGIKGKYSVIDSKRLAFRITPTVQKWLDVAIEELEKLSNEIALYRGKLKQILEKEKNIDNIKSLHYKDNLLAKELEQLRILISIFNDMKKNSESDNIYWASFYENNKITIRYIPKNNSDILTPIFSMETPIILTSATMEAYNNYQSIFNGLELTKIDNRYRRIITAEAQVSPYNYEENSLFYYDETIEEPNETDEYIKTLAQKIDELIRMTEGKALILFTSKNTMNKVYSILSNTNQYPFKLLLQTDNNSSEIKNEFANDTNSCLFATGTFWEGIDIKGSSLSNLIITRLPFDNVDAVTQYEASKFTEKEQMKEVYLPMMLTKLEQGVGRLIRSYNDTGIVCCLDSRVVRYLEDVKKAVPMTVFTTNINDAYKFSDEKITHKGQGKPLTLQKQLKVLDEVSISDIMPV